MPRIIIFFKHALHVAQLQRLTQLHLKKNTSTFVKREEARVVLFTQVI